MPKFGSALQLPQQVSPANPPAGFLALFAKAGDILFLRTSAGVERPLEPGVLFPFSQTGNVAVATGTFRIYNDSGSTLVIRGVRASVGTAPTGAAIIVDVRVNGTTIYGTPGNRPTIAISANTSGKNTGFSTTTIADASYFTVDVIQIGSTVAGANLTVQITC